MGQEKHLKNVIGQNLVILTQVKEGFLNICKQFDLMGQLLKLEAKTLSHPIFTPTSAPVVLGRILGQYQEIGEQLKHIGKGLDAMGGKPISEPLPKFTKPKMKKEIKETIEKSVHTFVSNIQPEEKK